MGSDSVNQMFQKHLLEEGHLHYGEFMNDLSRLIVSVVCSGADVLSVLTFCDLHSRAK